MSNSSSAHDAQISMSDKFPFEIHEDEIDKSVTPIFKDYPRECLPEKFKNPSGAKAKKLQYEIIDPNLYEPPARMVACRIKRNRLEAWIRALGVLYYEHFGKKAELFQVDWYDDPHQWEGEGNKAICINLTNDKQLIYKITLFITTGVLQAQGLSKDLFTTRDFPTLIKLVNSICLHNPSLIVNTDVDSTCKSSDKNSIEESTSVKSVFNSTASSVDNKLTDSNNNSHTSIQANVPTSNTCTETTIATQAKISIGYEDLDRLQTTFVEALAGITKSQTALIVQAEKSFSDVIRSAITPVVETVKKLQEQVNNKHQSDTILHNASTCNIKEHSNMEKQFNKLEHRIIELENQVHNLSMDKHKAATDYAELDSKFRIENNKFEIAKTRMDQKMEDINHINDDLKVKLNTKSSEMMKISEENKLLKEKTDSQFNEILSLKSQLSSMYLPTQQQNEQQFANGSFNNEGKSNKPTALFIGTSNTDRINENKLSTAVDITKTTAYTLDEAYEVISTAQCRPDVVIIHSLTNDVKNNNPSECMDKLQMVVESISSKWKEAKTIVSLTTPRLDNRLHRLNSEIIDGLVKRKYLDNKDVYVSDNSNMWHGQVSIQQLLNEDKFHLSERGTSMLASNIKNALHTVFGIKVQQRNNRYSRSTDRARQQYRPQHRQSFNNYHDHNEQNRVKFKRTG